MSEAGLGESGEIIRLVQELAQESGEQSALDFKDVADYLLFPGCTILLAEAGGETVGLLSYAVRPNLYHARECCVIDELVVSRGARGKGVGSALISEVIRRGIEAGWAEVSVSTLADNQPAIDFYRRYGLTDEALLLERHLQPDEPEDPPTPATGG